MIKEAIERLLDRRDLTEADAGTVMNEIMEGRPGAVQTAAYLIALRSKGESVGEISGSVRSMRKYAVHVNLDGMNAIDLCGTGGDGKGTFNISTTAAFVVAGAGVKVAKHGNRAASSSCGSADLLEALGAGINLKPDQVAECVEKAGVGFMFAPLYHPAMKNVAPVRKELGVRTIFNILGPLANPAEVKKQVVGVFKPELVEKLACVFSELGAECAIIVHNRDGHDEATTTGTNEAAIVRNGKISMMRLKPEEFGFEEAQTVCLKGGTPLDNAERTLQILNGEKGPCADTVVFNSGIAIFASGKSLDIKEGCDLARESIKSGEAKNALRKFVELSKAFSEENR